MLGGKMGRELTLRRATGGDVGRLRSDPDRLPPSLGLLTVNALAGRIAR